MKQWLLLGSTPFEVQDITSTEAYAGCDHAQVQFNHFSREQPFLQWRYLRHPVYTYKQFFVHSADAGSGHGVYVCLREELGVEGLRMLHVLDCVGDGRDMPSAVSFIHHYCTANNFHVADFYCTATRISRYFSSSGWFSMVDDGCFRFPHLFSPLEFRDPPTTSLIYWTRLDMLELSDTSNLYVTKQDADLDRPTQVATGLFRSQWKEAP